jgi:two-component system cell cycle response regulator
MPRILIIEDNPANLELMSYLLSAYNYTPQIATDGGAGLEAALSNVFDLIICDVHMPVLDGYEVARSLKTDPTRRNVPIVAVTALAMVGDRDKVLAAGFDGYISKPIDPETFVQQVEGFLRGGHRTIATPTHASAASAAPAPYTGQTILVVDNLPINLDLARGLLEPQGYQVWTAEGMEQALALARAHPCNLILSDVCMTGASGYDFIRVVKADPQLAAIPFVFITSTVTDEVARAKGLALGAARFLFRPIEPDALLGVIQTCLQEAGRFAHGDDSDR